MFGNVRIAVVETIEHLVLSRGGALFVEPKEFSLLLVRVPPCEKWSRGQQAYNSASTQIALDFKEAEL